MELKEKLTNLSIAFDNDPSADNAEALLQQVEYISWGLVAQIEKAKKVFFAAGRIGSETLPLRRN